MSLKLPIPAETGHNGGLPLGHIGYKRKLSAVEKREDGAPTVTFYSVKRTGSGIHDPESPVKKANKGSDQDRNQVPLDPYRCRLTDWTGCLAFPQRLLSSINRE
jgi:hypothetical protein